MKKIILLFTMMLAVAGVQAKSNSTYACSVTFPTDKGSNCSYDTGSKLFSWTAANSNYMAVFQNLKGKVNLEKYRFLNVKVTNLTSEYRILIYCDNKTSTASYTKTCTGDERIDLTAITLGSGETQDNINLIRIAGSGSNSSGSFNIVESDVYLETGDYEAMDITTTLTNTATKESPLQMYNGTSDDKYTGTKFVNKIGESVGSNVVIYGHLDGGRDGAHIDVTGYDITKVTLSTAAQNQVRFFNPTSDTSKDLNITTAAGTTEYIGVLGALNKIYNVKSQNGGTQSNITVSSIDFVKEFNAENENIPFNIAASSSSTVAYDRTFPTDKKSTVCLPFALTEAEVTAAGTFYELTSVDGTTLKFSPVTTTEAYKPYVFEAKKANPFASLTNKAIEASAGQTCQTTVGGYTFQGTLAHQTLPSGVYGYNAANGAFSVTTTNAVTIDAFRGYITYNGGGGAGARELNCIFSDGEVTGIETVRQSQQDGVMYNLQGQRVGQGHKGLFIMNGRKYVIK